MIPWTWQIALYLWLAGMAGGAYCAAFLADRASGRKQKELLQIATWIGVPMVLLGAALLTLELGQGLRFWHLFTEFFTLSPMSIGSWLLLIWAAVGVVLIALWFAEAFESVERQAGLFARVASWLRPLVPATEVLLWVAFVLSILLVAYTGVLLSATNQPLWSETWLLPALFVVSAISTGIGALVVALLLRRRTSVRALNLLGRVDPVVTLIELVTLVAFLVGLGATRTVITTGTLGVFFWGGAVLIGVLVPLGLGLRARVRGKESGYEALLAALWSILGGLVLRAVIVLGGQIYG
jgi:formate-dependent nitrite reductase membrane component NrfD